MTELHQPFLHRAPDFDGLAALESGDFAGLAEHAVGANLATLFPAKMAQIINAEENFELRDIHAGAIRLAIADRLAEDEGLAELESLVDQSVQYHSETHGSAETAGMAPWENHS